MKFISVDIEKLKSLVDQGWSTYAIANEMQITRYIVIKRMRTNGIQSKYKHIHSIEERKKISEGKRKWNKENPDRLREMMITRANNKNRSVPCERLKNWLREKNILFVEEYQPMREKNRFFSIDIAFPDKKIGIEVNGNQHYLSDGTLTPRYQERHNLIESEGWILYEVHYPICFKDAEIDEMIKIILNSPVKINFDYGIYRHPTNKTPSRKYPKGDNSWRKFPRMTARKYTRPTKEILFQMVWSEPVISVAKRLNISGSGVIKWCKNMGINTPPVGYWQRRRTGMSHEEALKSPSPKLPKHRITESVTEEIIKLKNDGLNWTMIGKLVGFERHAVRLAYLKYENGPRPGTRTPTNSDSRSE